MSISRIIGALFVGISISVIAGIVAPFLGSAGLFLTGIVVLVMSFHYIEQRWLRQKR